MSSYRDDSLSQGHHAHHGDRYSSSVHSSHFSSPTATSSSAGRRRSSRRSRSPRSSARIEDDWTRSTDAFLDTLTKTRGSFGTSPPQTTYNARSRLNHPNQAPLTDFHEDRRSPPGLSRKSRSPSSKKKSDQRSASSSSDESAPKTSEVTMSKEEHDKLKAQRQQYRDALRKLEDQLMKLKEQREALKASGAKHEDLIMKENARFQKELKVRIQKMGEIIGKVESALERAVVQVASQTRSRSGSISPVPKKPKKRAQSRSPMVEEREPESKMRGSKHSDHRGVNTSSEDDESKAKSNNANGSSKKKRKKKSKNSSSSAAEDSDSDSKRRKRKRRKDKKRSTSSSSSESEGSDVETQAKKKSTAKGENSGGGAKTAPSNPRDNDELMALLAKMSDAFMKSKKDCKELQARINVLEAENIVLKKQVKELRTREEERNAEDQAKKEREIQEQAEKERSQIMEKAHLLLLDNAGMTTNRSEDHRGAPRNEDHRTLKEQERRQEVVREEPSKESDRRERPERHSRSSPGRRRSSREREERRRERSRRDESPRRDRSRKEESPKRDRSHRENRKEAPEVPKPTAKADRNDKINLDDWVSQPQVKAPTDPNLESIRAKVMEKRQKMQDEDKRSRWATVYQSDEAQSSAPPEPMEPVRAKTPEDQKLPDGPRAHVALQWGSHSKKATSPSPGNKKANAPVIGKMPGRSKRSSITPQRTSASPSEEREIPKTSRFGPRSDLKSIPPPTVVEPNPGHLHQSNPPSSSSYGITREMYMQAITATMPTEPPPPQEMLAMRYQQVQQPPKNPTPSPMDINSILAAAQQHIQSKVAQMRTPKPVAMKMPSHQSLETPGDIPLPPLPAAVDKDDMATMDTRPPKVPTPPLPVPKTELDLMMEKHASPKQASPPPEPKVAKPSPFEAEESIEMDPDELAMLGIDPNDLTGFGAKKD